MRYAAVALITLIIAGSAIAQDDGGIPIQPAPPTSTPTPTRTPMPTATNIPAQPPTLGAGPEGNTPVPATITSVWQPQVRSYGWALPNFGSGLASPTAYATSETGLSATSEAAASNLENLVATLEMMSTLEPLNNVDGSAFNRDEQLDEMNNWLIALIGFIKGLDPDDWGHLSILIDVLLSGFVLIFSVQAFMISMRLIAALIGNIRKFANFVVNIIRG